MYREIKQFRGMKTLEVIALWICGVFFFTVKMYLLILSAM